MIVNYVRDATRDSPVNIAVARVVLAGYLVWKTLPYDWLLVAQAPFAGFATYRFAIPPWPELLVVEKWLLMALLCCFAVGYRIRVTALGAALIVGHFGMVRFVLNTSGGATALFFSAWYLLFFALYAGDETDGLSVDAVRRTGTQSLDELRAVLKDDGGERTYTMAPLRWSLLAFAIIYFGSGVSKLYTAGLAWFAPSNLSQNLYFFNVVGTHPLGIGATLVEYPLLVSALAVGTVVLEVGLLLVILLGLPVWPVVLGLLGMHTGVALLMGIVFFDVVPMFALFVAWDRLYARAVRTDRLDVVYDEFCYFCSRSLYPFKLLDVNGTVRFHSQSDLPRQYRERDGRDGIDFDRAMYAFRDGVAYEGYDAFRQLLRQFTVFAPLAWVMGRAPIRAVGERIYRHVAANWSQYFVCRVALDDPESASATEQTEYRSTR
jgi:predicted DCC family thiol-disulfide oxidoreductase YuxK